MVGPVRVLTGLACALLCGVSVTGCSTGPKGAALFGEPERTIALGDWNDVDAAVASGARAAEMALVHSRTSPDGTLKTFDLTSIEDEPASLEARLKGEGGAGARPIELSARVGRFGNTQKERDLLKAVRRRIERLSGVDFSPMPDDPRQLLR